MESVTYWRDPDDLVEQLTSAFAKLDQDQAGFKDGEQGRLYFDSIGRRPARLFISNAAAANPLAHDLGRQLRLRNINYFQYKDPGAIPSGSDWAEKIRREVETCDVFVGLIGPGYQQSEWSMKELEMAKARSPNIELLLYMAEQTSVGFAGRLQVPELVGTREERMKFVLDDIQTRLRRDGHGSNQPARRLTLLGGSRETIIDAIRHVTSDKWPAFLAQLREHGISIGEAQSDGRYPRPRGVADLLFIAAQRMRVDGDEGVAELIKALKGQAPPNYAKTLMSIEERMTLVARGGEA